ncbi:DUF4432 family protein [Kineococcus gynurae]|uniref:DUF4432 family protein n=1 Tax=Kineococcus gynurae TaxID=452979 RepID=A0ABV5LMT8_9ACTN
MSGREHGPTLGPLGAAADAGLFAREDALVRVSDRLGMPGGPDPARVVHARVAGGFDVEILPSRGLDLGVVHVAGIPLSWVSPVADARALDVPTGLAWLSRFTGGLLTTCGPEHLGPPVGEFGLHGSASHLPAADVTVTRGVVAGVPRFEVTGTMERQQIFGPSIRLRRSIVGDFDPAGTPRLTVRDVLENCGPLPVAPRLLHHFNLGAPLLLPGTTVEIPAGTCSPRDPEPVAVPGVMGSPRDGLEEAVFEHTDLVRDDRGRARAVVTAPDGRRVTFSWNDAFPGCYQWILPARGRWALGIEPASAPMYPHAAIPRPADLAPGESLSLDVELLAEGF